MAIPQTVLITGAGTGIGALASFSLTTAGHNVYASMRDPEGRDTERVYALRAATVMAAGGLAGELRVTELDVLSEDSAVAAVETIVEEAGRLDGSRRDPPLAQDPRVHEDRNMITGIGPAVVWATATGFALRFFARRPSTAP